MGSKYAFAYLWNADTALCALFSFDYVLFSFGYALFSFHYMLFSFDYVLFLFGYALFSFDYVLFSFDYALFSFDYVLFSFDDVLILDKGASLIRFTKLLFDFQALIKMKPYQIVYLLSLIFM